MIIKLHDLIPLLNEGADKNNLFFYDQIPINYVSGKPFCGVNFFLTGFAEQNMFDSRWITDRDLENLHLALRLKAKPQNIFLRTATKGQFARLVSIPVYSLSQLEIPPLYRQNSSDEITSLDQILEKVPYVESHTTYYSKLHNVLYIKEGEKELDKVFYYLALYMLQNAKDDEIINFKRSTQKAFWSLALELARVKIAYQTDTILVKDDFSYDFLYMLKKSPVPNNESNLKELFRAIYVGEKIALLCTREPIIDIKLQKLRTWLSQENFQEIYKLSQRKYADVLISSTVQALESAQQASTDETAFLHYSSKTDSDSIEYYITRITDDFIYASHRANGTGIWEQVTLSVQDLHSLDLDTAFKATKLSLL